MIVVSLAVAAWENCFLILGSVFLWIENIKKIYYTGQLPEAQKVT